MPMFSSVEILASGFVPAHVFHLGGKILEGMLRMPSLEVAHAITWLNCELSLQLKLFQRLRKILFIT